MAQRFEQLKDLIGEVISLHISQEGFEWLTEKSHSAAQFHSSFVIAPRKTGRRMIDLTAEQRKNIEDARSGFSIQGWTADRLARVWLLLSFDASDKEKYIAAIEKLFTAAEVNELVALYSALPVLEYPQSWVTRCTDGIRSNIGDVLLAIMCNNPYPSENLSEAAWNQLVLKAFFTEKPVYKITGLDTRANPRLASMLTDYAHERRAAHRSVNPQLWRLVGKFIDKDLFGDIEKLSLATEQTEKEAAALACNDSSYGPAKELLNRNKDIQSAINSGELTWDRLAEKNSDYVLQ